MHIACPATATRGSVLNLTATLRNATPVPRTITRGIVGFHAGRFHIVGPLAFGVQTTTVEAAGEQPTQVVLPVQVSVPASAERGTFLTVTVGFLGQVGANPKRTLLGGDACAVEIQ